MLTPRLPETWDAHQKCQKLLFWLFAEMQYISITKHEHGDVFPYKTLEDSIIQTEHKIKMKKKHS